MKRIVAAAICAVLLAPATGAAADAKGFEVKSPHFTVWSSGNKGAATALVWQLEQIRFAVKTQWPWAHVDLVRPMLVIAARDERQMRDLTPQYWETKGSVHPASVWVSGADRHYIAIRTDQRGDDTATLNPHMSVYFTYVNLVLAESFPGDLPLWFSRGLSGVLSNTLVRADHIDVGRPVPHHIETLQQGRRLHVQQLLSVTRESADYREGGKLEFFDAESWAFVHFLMFGDNGTYLSRLNRFTSLLNAGTDAQAASVEALGNPDDFEVAFTNYIRRTAFVFQRMKIDAGVKEDTFALRALSPQESAGGLAVFQVAMRRPVETQARIDEARQGDPNAPDAFLAEALRLDAAGKGEEAKTAFRKAADLGSVNAYAHYRVATLCWPRPDEATLQTMEKDLSRAIELHPAFAAAHAALGEVRSLLNQPSAAVMPEVAKAIELEPSSPWHHLVAARVLWRMNSLDEARKSAEVALRLADTDQAREQAAQLLASMKK